MKYTIGEEKFFVTPRLATLIKKYSKNKSLDAGCGTGDYFKYFKGDIYGFDITSAYLREIKKKNKSKKKIVLKNADVRSIPFKDEEFDFVFSAAVLEYMPNKKDLKKAVTELKRVMKNGGVMVVSTPHKNVFTDFIRGKVLNLFLEQKAEDPYFIMGRSFTKNELEDLGFKLHGCLGWVTWKNVNPTLAKILDIFFWYVPFFSGTLIGIYEKK